MTDNENFKRDKAAFDKAVETRTLEIELFWKRSIFFWGFIASAFVGYAALHSKDSDLSILVACFGMVCSAAWTLVNRGSKYWQENWETKVEEIEERVTGPLFKKQEPIQTNKGLWLRARRYSVTKLTIALSDFTFLLWLVIVLYHGWILLSDWKGVFKPVLIVFSLIFVALMLWKGKSTIPDDRKS